MCLFHPTILMKIALANGPTWDLFSFRLFSAQFSRLDHSAAVPSYSTLLMWRPGIELWSAELHHLEGSKFRTPCQVSYSGTVSVVSLL